MKRSEINKIIKEAEEFFNQNNFYLPIWAHWTLEDWKNKKDICQEIVNNGLGWDITDFGQG
jgi:D-lyxose ketol-isomerase